MKTFFTGVALIADLTIVVGGGIEVGWILRQAGMDYPTQILGIVVTALILAAYLWDMMPALRKGAEGSALGAGIMLKNLKRHMSAEDDEVGETPSGSRNVKSKSVRIGFHAAPPNTEIVSPQVPAPKCQACNGLGHSADNANEPCPACKGSGRKTLTYHV
jgi:hypothetical protein